MANLNICHKCEFRQRGCNGPCACTIDGKDIIEHANTGECPKGFFSSAPETSNGCGDFVHRLSQLKGVKYATRLYQRITERVTGKDCGCEQRREKLNRIGRAIAKRLDNF